jgi:hypothetical protein
MYQMNNFIILVQFILRNIRAKNWYFGQSYINHLLKTSGDYVFHLL